MTTKEDESTVMIIGNDITPEDMKGGLIVTDDETQRKWKLIIEVINKSTGRFIASGHRDQCAPLVEIIEQIQEEHTVDISVKWSQTVAQNEHMKKIGDRPDPEWVPWHQTVGYTLCLAIAELHAQLGDIKIVEEALAEARKRERTVHDEYLDEPFEVSEDRIMAIAHAVTS